LVLTSRTAHIYLLPRPSPIATAPGCGVDAHSLTSFTVHCRHASLLTYRELSFKGWTASVRGHPAAIGTVGGVFQDVAVPKGRSTVTFNYTPPDALFAWLAALLALLVIAGSL